MSLTGYNTRKVLQFFLANSVNKMDSTSSLSSSLFDLRATNFSSYLFSSTKAIHNELC